MTDISSSSASAPLTVFLEKMGLFLTTHDIQVKDISNELTMITASKIFKSYAGRRVLLVAQRNQRNTGAFGRKTKNERENILAIYKNQYRCFIFDLELEEALKEVQSIIEKQG